MSNTSLRRYTDLPALIYLLSTRKITLLDPQSWDDRNDSHYLTLYRRKKRLENVLVLCFTGSTETYHHWRVFSNGSGGVCIRFKRASLLAALRKQPGVRSGRVTYLTLKEIRTKNVAIRELPFLKRFAFEHENEYRVLFESKTDKRATLDIDIPLSCIERITLSPWLHPSFFAHVKRTIKSIKGCGSLEVVRSTLIGNTEWKNFGESAA